MELFHTTLPALDVNFLIKSLISGASSLSVFLADLAGIRLKYLLVLLTR